MPEGNSVKSKKALLDELESLRKENEELRIHIEEQERFYDVVSIMASEMFWRTDAEHRFTYMSPAVVESVDMPMAQQLGKTRAELADDDLTAPHWRQHLNDLEAHRPFRDFRYSRRHSNGELREITATGRPVFDEHGEFHGYIGVASDITNRLKTEAKAKSAEDILMVAINSLDCIFTIWDSDDRLTYHNDHFLELNKLVPDYCRLGVTFEEHVRAVAENGLIGNDEDPETWVRNRLRRHRNPSGSFETSRQNGHTILIHESRLSDGSTIIMSTDISEQKKAELAIRESRQRLMDFSSTAADWFWEMNADLKYTYISVDDETVTGLRVADYIGRTHRETKPRRFGENRLRAFEESLKDRRSFSDVRYSHVLDDGTEVHVAISGKPVFSDAGEFIGYRGGGRNIAGLVETEEELRREKERAEQASRAKSEFLAHMSHELRTPLNAILGFSEIIRHQIFGPVGSDSYLDYASDIHRSGEHLLSLINDLLDLSKIEAGKFDIEEEELVLADLVEQSERLFAHRFSQRQIRFDVRIAEDAQRIYADRRALAQILFNLLSNAEKFNNDGGAIDVTAFRGGDGTLCVAVKDTGCGFRVDDKDTALAPFGRIENPMTKETPGTGLGLPIVSALMDLHDGTMEVSSEIDVGTEIRLLFPEYRVR
ncbi:MAG: PAS-domain containing protein [Rhodospirillales bacterium]|nr:PAS-domain containing protein [Rhodospirillales bacterium]MBO6786631.1 PAS-domain containing protein [Rhodospirillales bacterium]